MPKKINLLLNIVIGSFIGIFIGNAIYRFLDFKMHPGLCAMQSAPWYTSILLYGVVTVIAVAFVVIIKLIIGKNANGRMLGGNNDV